MKKYVEEKNNAGNHIFNINETYNRIKLAARVIASVPNLSEVIVVCSKEHGQRAVQGAQITKREVGDKICQEFYGPDTKMAEHHDGAWMDYMNDPV